ALHADFQLNRAARAGERKRLAVVSVAKLLADVVARAVFVEDDLPRAVGPDADDAVFILRRRVAVIGYVRRFGHRFIVALDRATLGKRVVARGLPGKWVVARILLGE